MKSKHLMRAVLGGALLLSPVAALAGIDNSHHDIPYMDATVKEKCAYCHAVVLDPAAVPPATKAALKKVGTFCVVVCHLSGSALSGTQTGVVPTSSGSYGLYSGSAVDVFNPATIATHPNYGLDGTLAMTPNPGTRNTVAVFTGGHQMDPFNLGTLSANEQASMEATLWPHTANGAEMQCTSCHAVHDATNPPFLNAQLDGFCQKCHSEAYRGNALGGGNHPTGFKWDVTAANGRNRDLGPFNGVTNLNLVVSGTWTDGTDKATFSSSKTNSWNMGGHLLETTYGMPVTSAFATNTVSCVTCHIVHEENGGGTGEYGETLTVGNDIETVCYGCHSIEPGRTGKGHPIGQEATVSAARGWQLDLEAKLATTGYAGITGSHSANATTKSPKCVTCHDVHGAATGRLAIRKIGTFTDYVATPASVCDACHNQSFSNPNGGANKHHPGQLAPKNYNADNNFPVEAAWKSADNNGTLTAGLQCQDCHVGNGTALTNSTAHNW